MKRRDFINFAATTALFALSPFSISARANSKVLILIELQGANDGLNTIIPIKDKGYYKLRPNIGIPKKDILGLDAKRDCVTAASYALNNPSKA